MSSTDNDASPVPFQRIARWIEQSLKITALLVVFGYMSFRSHMNYLGISSLAPLPSERYLMEAYQWLLVTIMPLAGPVPVVGVLLLAIVYALGRFFRRVPNHKKEDAWRWWQGEVVSVAILLVLTVGLIVLRLRFGEDAVAENISVGPLLTNKLPDIDGLRTDRYIYQCLCTICAATYAFLAFTRLRGRARRSPQRFAVRCLSYVALGMLALQIPLLFGRVLDSNKFAEVTVRQKEEKLPVHGLLVLETSESFVVWRVIDGNGETVAVPRDTVLQIEIGASADLLDWARASITKAALK
jgi:hypothetical protein